MTNFKADSPSLPILVASLLLALTFSQASVAQQTEETVVRHQITVGDADSVAAANALDWGHHLLASSLPGAREAVNTFNAENAAHAAASILEPPATQGLPSEAVTPQVVPTTPYFYPADVAKLNGPTVATAIQHNLYVNYTGTVAANWGNPEQFLSDLNRSTMIHLTDQYTRLTTSGRYTVATGTKVVYGAKPTVIYPADIFAIVHAAAQTSGSGLNRIYHVFLPRGIDTCINSLHCYAPDARFPFTFCAYHGYIKYADLGVVLYSVEPFQPENGCKVKAGTPNGVLMDSTYSTLSHELFDIITDPEPGIGWANHNSFVGDEISDECQPTYIANSGFAVPSFVVNTKSYALQEEYSNTYHACAVQP